MLDAAARRVVERPLAAVAARVPVPASALTLAGLAVGVGACVAAATAQWWVALALWLGNRLLDGLDGAVARRRGVTDLGGFLDVVSDFTVYGGFVLGVSIAVPDARLACLALLLAYYVSGTAFLVLSSILERRASHGLDRDVASDGRSVRFVGGLAEGTETVIAYVAFCLWPGHAEVIAWVFAAAVAITAAQRVAQARALLSTARQSSANATRPPRHS